MRYRIRRVISDDLPALSRFFRAAYGADTVLQDLEFLTWLMGDGSSVDRERGDSAPTLNSMIAMTPAGNIVAHYGAISRTLETGRGTIPMLWGVNAFTLPEHRGQRLGQALIEPLLEATDAFGVIGFSPRVAEFYERIGFNLFGRDRFQQRIRVFDSRYLEIARWIGADPEPVRALLSGEAAPPAESDGHAEDVVEAAALEWDRALAIDHGGLVATARTASFLRTRFLGYRPAGYRLLGCRHDGAIRAYVAVRRTSLAPTRFRATRIVDVFGSLPCLRALVGRLLADARAGGDVYIDFSSFGTAFDPVFDDLGFHRLPGDEAAIVPQLTSPLRPRPNHEHVGMYSRKSPGPFAALAAATVFFTRADSDRDRPPRQVDAAFVAAASPGAHLKEDG